MFCFACGNYNIVLTCHIYTNVHICTHTHKHTHSHTHTDLNVAIFQKDCKIKYTSNRDNAGPQNTVHRNLCILMKTSDLRKLLGNLRKIN